MKSTVPLRIRNSCATFSASASLPHVASRIAEAAWAGKGVRLFRWPCGRLVMTRIGSASEAGLLEGFGDYLLGTWAKGAMYRDVLAELQWVRQFV